MFRLTGWMFAGLATVSLAQSPTPQRTNKPAPKPTPAADKQPEKVKRARTVDDDIEDAINVLRLKSEKADPLLVKGDVAGAVKILTDTFPESTRTPAQSLVLGQALYRQDPDLAYQLIKAAAAKVPDNATVQLEWALAQHRAKEYAGAMEAYDRTNAMRPGFSPVLGVAAECALRLGKVERAIEIWKQCLAATRGTQENFEQLVCEVNGRDRPMVQRAELVKRVQKADENAAIELILLDSDWPTDWWTKGPNRPYLEADLLTVGKWILPGGNPQVQEARAVGALAMIERPSAEKVSDLLKRARYLLDEEGTMPANGKAMVLMLKYAIRSGALKRDDARGKLGPKILEVAKKSKDPNVFEAAGFLYMETGKQDEVDKLGWELANDPRGAASKLATMLGRKELTWETPELQKALKDFPENSAIWAVALNLGIEAGQPKKELLTKAILAEYAGFSLVQRDGAFKPRADVLRRYWQMLTDEYNK